MNYKNPRNIEVGDIVRCKLHDVEFEIGKIVTDLSNEGEALGIEYDNPCLSISKGNGIPFRCLTLVKKKRNGFKSFGY